ncbi:MAG: energy transducer TonB [Candidatus Aminicenantes bacterium]|nr:energy transducer TonB [Candidatus Aminicenantes bacterium]
MFKKKLVLFIVFLMGFSLISLHASVALDIKLRLFEGIREGMAEPPRFVTSSFLHPTITANIQTEFELEKEKRQIQRVFNLKDVNLLTEADLKLGAKEGSVGHFFRLNGNEYEIRIRLMKWKGSGQFLVLVNEINDEKKENILVTEFTLVGGNIAVFGFEDKKGKPYFLSFHVTGPEGKVLLPPPPPPPASAKDKVIAPAPPQPPMPPPPPPSEKQIIEFAEGAVRVIGEMKTPRPIKMVKPIYPKIAKQALVRGTVILSVRIDEEGRVEDVMVLRSIPLLSQAAVDAVRQWKYEPFIIEGKPCRVVFTVTVQFNLR